MNESNTNKNGSIKNMDLAIETLSNEVEENVRRALLNNCAYVFQYELGSAYQCCLQQAYHFLGYYNENALAALFNSIGDEHLIARRKVEDLIVETAIELEVDAFEREQGIVG
jgi:hypothetical protein